jgi:hypothetical protein
VGVDVPVGPGAGLCSANFGFLAENDEQLVRLAALAERYFADDPNTSLIKLRQFSELLALEKQGANNASRHREALALESEQQKVRLSEEIVKVVTDVLSYGEGRVVVITDVSSGPGEAGGYATWKTHNFVLDTLCPIIKPEVSWIRLSSRTSL